MKNEFLSPGFIVGVERSGTTLLAAMLNRHSKVCVTPETKFFQLINGYNKGLKSFLKDWPNSLDKIVNKMPPTSDWRPSSDEIIKRLNGDSNAPRINEIFEALGNTIAEKRNKKLWIEKTPHHIRYLSQIRNIFPNAPIIHIVRDGRDVAESKSRMGWQHGSYFNSLLEWKDDIAKAEDFMISDGRFMTVRFEDLITDAYKTVSAICEFLQIEYEAGMLVPDGTEAGLIEMGRNHKELIKKPITKERLQIWKKILPVENQGLATMLVHDHLKKWGYEYYFPTFERALRIWSSVKFYNQTQASCYDQFMLQLFKDGIQIKVTGICSANEKLPDGKTDMYILTLPVRIDPYSDNINQPLKLATLLVSVLFNFFCLKLRRIPMVWIYHGNIKGGWRSRYQKYIDWLIFLFADWVVCPCKEERCVLEDRSSRGRLEILHIDENLSRHLCNRLRVKLGNKCHRM